MAAGKSSQSNTSLVALVVFIVLFLICAVVATIFYTKFEDQKALTASAEAKTKELASPSEQNNVGSTIIGTPIKDKSGKSTSYIGTMSTYLDDMIMTIIGELPEANAKIKINDAKMQITNAIKNLGDDATAIYGEKDFDLLHTIGDLKLKLDTARDDLVTKADSIDKLSDDIELNLKQYLQEKTQLIASKEEAMKNEQSLSNDYETLKAQWNETSDEQMQNWADKLEAADEKHKLQGLEIVRLTDEVAEASLQLTEALAKLESLKTTPDNNLAATQADAFVFNADLQNKLIYLNVGSKDHVYPGLTFTIYDRNAPIPEDGKGKAEIEVFRVKESSCVAKMISSSKKDPVIEKDIAVNMIWDSKTSNSFMIIGEFDFDGDGAIDLRGKEKIKQMITQWNGRIVTELTINTDFIVVGEEPKEMESPSNQEIDDNPALEQKFADSSKKIKEYQKILDDAKRLSIPVFSRKRFMLLTGYEMTAKNSIPSVNN
jgi:hypothetical protein